MATSIPDQGTSAAKINHGGGPRAHPPAGLADSTLLVVRRRYVGDGMREDVTIQQHRLAARHLRVTLAADADFADLFEVKDGRARPQAAASTSATALHAEVRQPAG